MTILQLFKKIIPFARPYRRLIIYTLLLTVVGSFAAQINAFILRYTVDSINTLMIAKEPLSKGLYIVGIISFVLMLKEVVYALLQFGQKFYGEKLRIYIARDFSQAIVSRVLSYKLAFYTSSDNEGGKLATRIDAGISSLTRLVQNFFIDILPLFANAIIALACMFYANVYVGLVGLAVIPLYLYISQSQATKLSGFRRQMRNYRES